MVLTSHCVITLLLFRLLEMKKVDTTGAQSRKSGCFLGHGDDGECNLALTWTDPACYISAYF